MFCGMPVRVMHAAILRELFMRLGCVSMCCLSAHEWAKSQFHQSCKHVCKTTPLKSWVHPLRAGIEPQALARRCIANIKDECAHDYGGCWMVEIRVRRN